MIVVSTHLLGRDLVGGGPHVDLLVRVHAGDDEEHARAPRPARQQPPQPEDDRPFVLLVQCNEWWYYCGIHHLKNICCSKTFKNVRY